MKLGINFPISQVTLKPPFLVIMANWFLKAHGTLADLKTEILVPSRLGIKLASSQSTQVPNKLAVTG